MNKRFDIFSESQTSLTKKSLLNPYDVLFEGQINMEEKTSNPISTGPTCLR